MNNDLNIKNPIQIKDNSEAQVALDLMNIIANFENRGKNTDPRITDPRKYYLELYKQCIEVVKFQDLPDFDDCEK